MTSHSHDSLHEKLDFVLERLRALGFEEPEPEPAEESQPGDVVDMLEYLRTKVGLAKRRDEQVPHA